MRFVSDETVEASILTSDNSDRHDGNNCREDDNRDELRGARKDEPDNTEDECSRSVPDRRFPEVGANPFATPALRSFSRCAAGDATLRTLGPTIEDPAHPPGRTLLDRAQVPIGAARSGMMRKWADCGRSFGGSVRGHRRARPMRCAQSVGDRW